MSNVILAPDTSDTTAQPSSLRLADDVKRGYCKCPTAHARDMRADGLSATAHLVYTAIANRQTHEFGECFRSNAGIADELGIHKSSVSRCISALKSKGYLSIWFINGGRRMRALTRVSRGVSRGVKGGTHQRIPDKENNIKKTTQQCGVSSISLSEKHTSLFGEGGIRKLVTTFGVERVERGLLAWDAEDQAKIRNPMGWLTRAVKDDYEPRKATRAGQPFTEDTFEHDRIIKVFMQEGAANVDKVNSLIEQGKPENIIAYKIWSNKL